MKRLFSLLTIVLLAAGCSSTEEKSTDNKESASVKRPEVEVRHGWSDKNPQLHGDVKSVAITEYELHDNFGEIVRGDIIGRNTYHFNEAGDVTMNIGSNLWNSWEYKYTYDDEGNVIERLSYDPYDYNSLVEKIIYKYDEKGKQTEVSTYNSDGVLVEKTINKYNTKGDITEKTIYNSEGSLNRKYLYKWNDDGLNTMMIHYDSNYELYRKEIYKYNENGYIVKADNYDSDGKLKYITTYKYNSAGYISEYKHIAHNGDGKSEFRGICKYDSEWNLIETISYNSDGSLDKRAVYNYDSNGNVIEITQYEGDIMVPKSLIEYNIIYLAEPEPYTESINSTPEEELDIMARTDQQEQPTEVQKVQTKVLTDALTIVSNDKKIDTPDLLFTEDASMFDDFEFDIGQVEEDIDYDDEIWNVLEDPATFRGGGIAEFRKWVMERIKYPQIAMENGIQGNVILEFVIDETGQLGRIKVLQSPDQVLSDAAISVLQKSPKWKPGKQRGEAVKMKFVLPVSFKIQGL